MHEKAALMALIPLGLNAVESSFDARLFVVAAAVTHATMLPLLPLQGFSARSALLGTAAPGGFALYANTNTTPTNAGATVASSSLAASAASSSSSAAAAAASAASAAAAFPAAFKGIEAEARSLSSRAWHYASGEGEALSAFILCAGKYTILNILYYTNYINYTILMY